MNNREYTILPANTEQLDGIADYFKINEKKNKRVIVYIAEDSHKIPVGRIVITERDIPSPLEGKRWYVYDLFVCPEHRRKGIASALVAKTIEEAEEANVLFICGSANASVEASCFWMNQGFSMNAYGRKEEDPTRPLFYGNYFHMFSHCMKKKTKLEHWKNSHARRLSKEEILRFIDSKLNDPGEQAFFRNRSDVLAGFAVYGDHGETMGTIIAFPDSMQAPLESVRLIVEVYVEEENRRQGIGAGLVCEMYRFAKNIGAVQLTNFSQTAEHIGFWYKIGFDVFFWDVNPNTGEYGTTAMLRVD